MNAPTLHLPVDKISCTLLVDDDRINNFLNQRLLEGLNMTDKLLTALNGKEALSLFEKECRESACPALILLDVNMPVMNGFEFLEAYDQLQITPKEPVIIIMLTTSLHPRDVERVQQLGIAGFLNKPLTKEKVNDILKDHFNRELPQE
ncbi:response regulator [Hymenobacter radiodurans]|uniref:response regulator n=1 Tax=Hymenobacter radiodurans TaxID=2496028 RepID=UPI001F0E98CC|nr:response regulator [Hymenobacter radiodurans]